MKQTKMNILLKRFDQMRFHDIPDFRERTGIPISHETLRYAIYEGRQVSMPILILICKYLGFSPAEIRDILRKEGDEDFWPLIGDNPPLTEADRAILDIMHTLREKAPDKLNLVADHLDLIGKASGLQLTEQTKKLRWSKATRRGRKQR